MVWEEEVEVICVPDWTDHGSVRPASVGGTLVIASSLGSAVPFVRALASVRGNGGDMTAWIILGELSGLRRRGGELDIELLDR